MRDFDVDQRLVPPPPKRTVRLKAMTEASWNGLQERIAALEAQLAEKDRQIERLRGDLDRFGWHTKWCAMNPYTYPSQPCSCGYLAAVGITPVVAAATTPPETQEGA